MDTKGGGEANASTECQSMSKKGHMANIYLTDPDEEAIVDIFHQGGPKFWASFKKQLSGFWKYLHYD